MVEVGLFVASSETRPTGDFLRNQEIPIRFFQENRRFPMLDLENNRDPLKE